MVTASGHTARTMTELLHAHYIAPNRPAGGIFIAEVESPSDGTRAPRRRADALWLPSTMAGGYGQLVGHEIKVSRSDVLAELSDLTKADAWQRYCTRWWLTVSDPNLVEGLDVPDSWGIMSPPSGRRTRSMTVLRPAPKLTPTGDASGMARVAIASQWRADEQLGELRRTLIMRDAEIRRLQTARDAGQSAGAAASPRGMQIARIVNTIEQRMRDERIWGEISDATVIEAVLDVEAARRAAQDTALRVRSARGALDRLLDDYRAAHDPARFDTILTDLAEVR